ncbi:MAG TPA: M50 family metallopeptidase [Candidatus Saccharimonadales bacterium]|nr:M50 family metallopeptidase [Candidatus Saccharimonadales bacterium]
MQILVFIVGILLFIGLVLVHEWGHFIMARRNGVDVEEFGLGFPPRAWGKKLKSGMMLSLNWLPLGGFVKLKGENDSDTRKGSLGAASLGAKTKIMLAGVTMNLLAGLFILTILALIGMPKLLTQDNVGQDQFTVASDTKVIRQEVLTGAVQPGSPAAKIGLRGTDQLISVSNGAQTRQFNTPEQIHAATLVFAGQKVKLTYKRSGHILTSNVQLLSKNVVQASLKTNDPKGYLGIVPTSLQIQRSTWSAPVVAVGLTKQIVALTFQGLGHAFAGLGSAIAGLVTNNHQARTNGQSQASSQVGGPVAIGVALWDYGYLGINFMLFLIALISLTLALMNVLPIPALDGGRLTMMLVSRGIFRRPLARATEEWIVGASFFLILALVALITVVDVKRFF